MAGVAPISEALIIAHPVDSEDRARRLKAAMQELKTTQEQLKTLEQQLFETRRQEQRLRILIGQLSN